MPVLQSLVRGLFRVKRRPPKLPPKINRKLPITGKVRDKRGNAGFFVHRGARSTGYYDGSTFVNVKEKIPELIVPDLKDCELKPYVSLRTQEIESSEPVTPKYLFDETMAAGIVEKYMQGYYDKDNKGGDNSTTENIEPIKTS